MTSFDKLFEKNSACRVLDDTFVSYDLKKKEFMTIYPYTQRIEDMHKSDANINALYMEFNKARVIAATATVAYYSSLLETDIYANCHSKSRLYTSSEEIQKEFLTNTKYKIEFARLNYASVYERFAVFASDKTLEKRTYYEMTDNLSEAELACKYELNKVDTAYADLILIEI